MGFDSLRWHAMDDDVDNRRPAGQPTSEPPPVKLAEFSRYPDAQQAVDQLSDEGFPMLDVTIVWAGLRHIEHVTGRRTVATAAREGLLSGAWFGLIIGLLFTAFADEAESTFGVLLVYILTGALTVAAYQAGRHWIKRGTRDFSTVGQMDAERYEVWVSRAHHARAQSILGLTSIRPTDPPSSDDAI